MIIPAPNTSIAFWGIKFYSIFMALAIFSGCLVSYLAAKKYFSKKVNPDILLDLLPITIISGVLGARIYYVLANFRYFITHTDEIIKIQNGGISIHGAILGGIIGAFCFCKIKKIKILPYADATSLGLILAQAIGRIGNYFNQEAFGAPSDTFLKMYIEKPFRGVHYADFEYFHPTFLYEIVWNLFVFTILFLILKKINAQKSGTIFFSYLLLYSIGRFLIEAIRTDSVLNIGGVPVAQIASILLILVGLFGLLKIYKGGAS